MCTIASKCRNENKSTRGAFHMQRLFTAFKQSLCKKILVIGIFGLSILSSLFIFAQQPSLAAAPISTEGQKLIQQEQRSKDSQAANEAGDAGRERAYEEQIQAAKDPDKVFENNLKEYNASHPENLIEKTVEGAKQAVDKVTGKD